MKSVNKSFVGTSQFRNAAVAALAVCSFTALLMPVPAAADARLEATKTDRGGVIALEWPVPVTVETERDVKARELLLRFDQPLGTVPFARIQEVLGGLVETVEYGYDSVLIRVAPDVRVTPTNLASGVQIALSGAVEAAAGKPAAQSASQPGQSLTQADYLYIAALEAMDNKPEQIRFWSGKLDAGVLSGKEATGAVHRLIALGADAQALPYLKRFARERKGAWLYAYADAADRVGAGARDQFADFLEAELRRRDLSDAEVDERVALFYARSPQRAVTSLSARAIARGGASASVHLEAMIKLGQKAQATELMTQLAANPRLPVTERRGYAYRLLETGARKPAEAAYREIAATEPPDGPDMRQLLFLWGPRPGAESLDWIEGRYRAAKTPHDRRVWIGYLAQSRRRRACRGGDRGGRPRRFVGNARAVYRGAGRTERPCETRRGDHRRGAGGAGSGPARPLRPTGRIPPSAPSRGAGLGGGPGRGSQPPPGAQAGGGHRLRRRSAR